MKYKKIFLCWIFFSCALCAFAVNNAEFWNLGFSNDSQYICFAQYWIAPDTLIANAELSVIDISKNEFVPNGRVSARSALPVSAGNNGRNTVVDLARSTHQLLDQYAITHAHTGRIIYLNVNGVEQTETINFTDFQSNLQYTIRMIQDTNSSGAAFHLRGTIAGDTVQHTFSVGLPQYYRPNILRYTIAQVILSPDSNGYAFIIEQWVSDGSSKPIARYMVETLSLSSL